MTLSFLLFQQMLSMMLMILMGFAAVKAHIVESRHSAVLSALTLYLIVPCVLIQSLQIDFTADKLQAFLLVTAAAILVHFLFIGICCLLGKRLSLTPIEKASLIYSNGGNLIIPLVTALLGEEQVFYCCPFIMVQLVFLWTHNAALLGGREQINPKKLLTNPNILAIAVGLLLFLCRLRLPGILATTVSSVGSTIGPVCMIMIGMIMANTDLKKIFLSKRSWLVCIGRLVLFPALMILFVRISGVTAHISYAKDVLLILLLAVCAPAAASVTQMASLFHTQEEQAGAINVMSVILSIFTMPLMVALYQLIL